MLLLAISGIPAGSYGQDSDTGKTLYLATSNLPPVVNTDTTGYLNKILLDLRQRTDMTFEIRKMPAARGLALADSGVLDGEVARTDAMEGQYPHLIRVPEPIIDVVVAGLHTREGIRVESLEDFSQYRVGHVRGWKFVESLFSDDPNVTVTRTVDQLLNMLRADRIDIAVMSVAPGRFMANERGMRNLKVTDYAVRKNMYLYLHESHVDLVPVIDSAIKAMKLDGSYDAIIEDYNSGNQ